MYIAILAYWGMSQYNVTVEPPDIETNKCDRRPNYVTEHQQTDYIHLPELSRLKVG